MKKCVSIGGQALIEGILMRSPEKTAMAVRLPDGQIDISYLEQKSLKDKYRVLRFPIIRGVVNFVESLIQGYKALMISAEKSGFADLEDENTDKKKADAILGVVMVIGSVLGVALAVALFMLVPRLAVQGTEMLFKTEFSKIARCTMEQVIKLMAFVAYVWAVSFMKDIKRTFMYHGAEHKTIFCYENGLPLTVENVRKQKRFHPRCGTSFMILMIVISIFVSTIIQAAFPLLYDKALLWVAVKILLVPLVCGLGYEVLKICGKHDNIFTRIISAPGTWLQRITTGEPDDKMIEIAIAAFLACEPQKIECETENDTTDNI